MGEHARNRGGDELVRFAGDGNRRRNADEDQERRHQEAAADPEQPGQHADAGAHPEQQKDIDRKFGNRQIDLHGGPS